MEVKKMYKQYYEARSIIKDLIVKDFVGPVKEDEVIQDTDPFNYYSAGILYPRGTEMDAEEDQKDGMEDETASNDLPLHLCNMMNPSSFAVSFSVRAGIDSLNIRSTFARYIPLETEEKGFPTSWKRQGYQDERRVPLINDRYSLHEGLELQVYIQKVYKDGSKTVTVSMLNTHEKVKNKVEQIVRSFFQTGLEITSGDEEKRAFIEKQVKVELKKDEEMLNLEMLYLHKKTYAIGHGCSVEWESDGEYATRIRTTFLPSYELFQMMPNQFKDHRPLNWKFLATENLDEVIQALQELVNSYGEWIRNQEQLAEKLPDKYQKVAGQNLEHCWETHARIKNCLELLRDPDVFLAFQLSNQAMLDQRVQQMRSDGKSIDLEKMNWYPFQLAFILQEIPSIVDPDDPYRNIVDLLWFPTGGGKTEAYLGLSAFTIFYRRIRAEREGRNGAGVTILMRYTLRLLTLQQFERAANLICACERIRKERRDGLLGNEEISIGLWVGELTPNKLENAKKAHEKILKNGFDSLGEDESNPCQVSRCPWCKTELHPRDYTFTEKGMIICCPGKECPFSGGLPIYLIDEDIYRCKPSLIVSTVDKFARMTWDANVGKLFGIDTPYLPPELIIQDELHLISGPLGTIAGLYEVAVDRFCSHKGIPPKIVASTATIRNAKEQIKNLYARDIRQFPPQGVNIRNSYFAIESNRDDRPSREYLGILAPGKTVVTSLIRLYAVLLFATRHLKSIGFPDEVVDSFWTITGYFNSIKQLGGAVVQVLDDVQARYKYLYSTKFSHYHLNEDYKREFAQYDELTSRKKSTEIGKILKDLAISFPDESAYDFILASNMLSVGIDVGRLGLMVVNGQPKLNAEYIQATSRVGRQTPGLVVTLYDPSRSRDRSHYEQFFSYHSSLYRFVEATSLTPFSERARDRALHAVLISLCRHLIPDLKNNQDASNINHVLDKVEEQIEMILNRVNEIDQKEVEATEAKLRDCLEQWQIWAEFGELYYAYNDKALLRDFTSLADTGFQTLNSMRHVDVEAIVCLEEK
jgi:hypothetical protein